MKCIIVGAGAAGLLAGYCLTRHGIDVNILEAQEQIGGRICRVNAPNFSSPLDLGAEFVHGDLQLTKKISTRAGGTLAAIAGKFYRIYNGDIAPRNWLDDEWSLLLDRIKHVRNDLTFEEFLQQNFTDEQHAVLREKATAFIEGYNAADARVASTVALREEWMGYDQQHQYRLEKGYRPLLSVLLNDIVSSRGTVHYGEVVKQIRWREGLAEVTTASGHTLEAEKILITVPVGVLQEGSIDFVPAIPTITAAARDIGFGNVIKYHVELADEMRKVFAGRLPDAGFVFADAKIPTWWTNPSAPPILTGWHGGPASTRIASGDAHVRMIVDTLSYILDQAPKKVREGIRGVHITDWLRNPYSRGAYSFATLKTRDAVVRLTRPINKTIYFAGEALAVHSSPGTVEAAFKSGVQAAARIINTSEEEISKIL